MIEVSEKTETCLIPKFMKENEYNEIQGHPFTYKGIDMYLVHPSKSWWAVEKNSHVWVVSGEKTQKEVLHKVETFLNNNLFLKRLKSCMNNN